MDSTKDTTQHIFEVQTNISKIIVELHSRLLDHDKTKLESPEKEIFDEATPKLKGLTYGSEEYKKVLEEIKPALDHHYQQNRHHPEHALEGIYGMNLVDLIEMLCDWMAATKRHNDGDIMKSIEINQKRFGYSDELKSILYNTIYYLETK